MQTLTFERIKRDLLSNDVVVYMKGTAVFPQCGFSAAIVQILSQLGVPFKDFNLLEDSSLHAGVKAYSNWPQTPQLYVKGEFVGGCDIVREMYKTGELQALLSGHGLLHERMMA